MKDYRLSFLLILLISISINLFSQNWPCEDTVHGVFSHIHMDCTQDIQVTSTQQDPNGTIIRGVITTSGSIIIIPGSSFVRIMPDGTQSKGIKKTQTHTTKIESNGSVGAKSGNKAKTKVSYETDLLDEIPVLEEIMVYPNPTEDFLHVQSASHKIIGYQISNFYGKIIKKENLLLTNKIRLSLVKNGIYLLRTHLENGTQQIEKIIKN
ncbi:T9SS type A sorting domain-containing protein [uncultured Polaribacter sp.]|uniref:T9SS type A sorting domain-containing protein n=1 Tax=uncultured Polaribacter sp. TaxID=174711 RepID=UPI00262C16F1|nr:T9SS type A sorting domain-containing protein [uncultured Polaribacter sp.]